MLLQDFQQSFDTSLASVKYSIPKTCRFKKPKLYCDKIYNKESTLSHRGTSMGYGTRSNFDPDNKIKSPGPQSYSAQCQNTQGISFGLSRESVNFDNYLPKNVTDVGPGELNNTSTLTKNGITISYKYKSKKQTESTPGPGQYQSSNNIKIYNSTFINSPQTKLNSKSSRFINYDNRIPGVGAYNPNREQKTGQYKQSQFQSELGKTFSLNKRKVFENQSFTPGPGSYRLPSIFG